METVERLDGEKAMPRLKLARGSVKQCAAELVKTQTQMPNKHSSQGETDGGG